MDYEIQTCDITPSEQNWYYLSENIRRSGLEVERPELVEYVYV